MKCLRGPGIPTSLGAQLWVNTHLKSGTQDCHFKNFILAAIKYYYEYSAFLLMLISKFISKHAPMGCLLFLHEVSANEVGTHAETMPHQEYVSNISCGGGGSRWSFCSSLNCILIRGHLLCDWTPRPTTWLAQQENSLPML